MSCLQRTRFVLAIATLLCTLLVSSLASNDDLRENDHEFNLLRDIRTFEVVTPKLLTHFESQSSVGQRYADHLEYEFQAYEQNFHLTLEKNKELFSSKYVEQKYVDNQVIEHRPNIDEINCYYWGKENRTANSNVAISTCDGLRGLITTSSGVSYYIEPAAAYQQKIAKEKLMGVDLNSAHIFYRVQDINQRDFACGVGHDFQHLMKEYFPQSVTAATADAHEHHEEEATNLENDSFQAPDSFATPVPAPADSSSSSPPSPSPAASPASSSSSSEVPPPPTTSIEAETPQAEPATAVPSTLYVELLLVNDNSRYRALGVNTESKTAALANMMNNFYAISNLSPAVRIVLVGQVTFATAEPYTNSFIGAEVDINRLLTTFQSWHTTTSSLPPHDAAQLLSSLNFYGPVIGYAPVNSMCQPYYSGGIIQATYGDVLNSMVAAHEMGHNFGMQHDGAGNSCATSGNIMYSVGCVVCSPNTVFSSCSKSYYAGWVANSRYKQCLYNQP